MLGGESVTKVVRVWEGEELGDDDADDVEEEEGYR